MCTQTHNGLGNPADQTDPEHLDGVIAQLADGFDHDAVRTMSLGRGQQVASEADMTHSTCEGV